MEIEDELITLNDVCAMLKMKPAGIYSMVFHHKIPCVKLSRHCLRFKKSEIDAWIQSKTQGTNQPTEPKPAVQGRKLGRPRKSAAAENNYVDSLVLQAIKEGTKNEANKA